MIRDNVVPSGNAIYSTDGVNGISANVIEQNQAYWEPNISDSRIPGSRQFTSVAMTGREAMFGPALNFRRRDAKNKLVGDPFSEAYEGISMKR